MKKIFRLGTRSSPLSLIQAESAKAALIKNNPEFQDDYEFELVPMRTTGDWHPEMEEKSLAETSANKGLFTKEIDEALLSGYIDVGVHSAKDVATDLPANLTLCAALERADPRDAFISLQYKSPGDLPQGAKLGTSSLRRRAQLLALRPDLTIVPLRGNVETRLKKLGDGHADATLLAAAGLQRLGIGHKATRILETNVMLPAAGQGVIALVTAEGNKPAMRACMNANHKPSLQCVLAERAFLRTLGGSCKTPIAALARYASDSVLVLEGLTARPDGTQLLRLQHSGQAKDAETIGEALGHEFLKRLPSDFFFAGNCP